MVEEVQQNPVMFQLFLSLRAVVQLSKHSKTRSDNDARSEIEATASEGRSRLTIIDCQKCQPLSACEGGDEICCVIPF